MKPASRAVRATGAADTASGRHCAGPSDSNRAQAGSAAEARSDTLGTPAAAAAGNSGEARGADRGKTGNCGATTGDARNRTVRSRIGGRSTAGSSETIRPAAGRPTRGAPGGASAPGPGG